TEMEALIRGQGYNDALVMHEKGKYDITVQTDSLSKKQAVEILELIQEETDVPATYLTISYHP
ncbi:MAG: SpoIIIAH-like family protein, partial [Novibacillus thermophilus]